MTRRKGPIGDLAADLDAHRFVGRTHPLAVARNALTDTTDHRLLYVHGPGGVGKSALLRAIGRAATAMGRPVRSVDGRIVAPTSDGLAEALHAPNGAVIIIDEVDELASLRFELRDLARAAPRSTVIVLAGRRPPGREWFDDGLDHVLADIGLQPFDLPESRELLRRYEVDDPGEVDAICRWSSGYPLALTVAATAYEPRTDDAEHHPETVPTLDDHGIGDLIVARLAGRELDHIDPDVLDVAAVAPTVDSRLLASVLPGRPTRHELTALRQLSVSERIGQRTTLHRLVRLAARARLRATDPERYRTLVLAVADHLAARARSDSRMGYELADLIEDPEARVGFGPSTSHYADRLRPGDLQTVADAMGTGDTDWFGRFTRYCDERPDEAVVVRQATGDLAGVAIIGALADIPAWARDEIELGPVHDHAETNGWLDTSVFMLDTTILHDPDDAAAVAETIRVGNAAAVAWRGAARFRRAYVIETGRRAHDGAEALGYGEVAELLRSDQERTLSTILSDFGEGGYLGFIHGLIRAEQGAPPGEEAVLEDLAIIDALRSFRDDEALKRSPLAPPDVPDAADSTRRLVMRAVDEAFGDTPSERALHRAITRTYLDPDGGHGAARAELHMSRSSFYRHLKRARHHLATHASADDQPRTSGS